MAKDKESTTGQSKPLRISAVHARATLGRLLDRVEGGQWVVIDRDRHAAGVIISVDDLRTLSKTAAQRLDDVEEIRLGV